MEGTTMADNNLIEMITRLDPEDLNSVKKYVAFLLAEEDDEEEPTMAEKQKALEELRRHRGVLGGADREALRASAMEEKYGRVS